MPQEIKMDNGPAYGSTRFARFCNLWGIHHGTGIPHLPTGQAIVEWANQTLKEHAAKTKGGNPGLTPRGTIGQSLICAKLS